MSSIYPTVTKGKTLYKVHFTYESRKIYLGSTPSLEIAESMLATAQHLMQLPKGVPTFDNPLLDYKKTVALCNFRDSNKYIKNPIYLVGAYFYYYLSPTSYLILDFKELLYFSTYRIYKRGNYLYTQDSISQKNILLRFGIPNHSVLNKDYYFRNNNPLDFRAENIVIINSYKGVTCKQQKEALIYVASIYHKGTIIIGHYPSETEAAIAYNKAADLLISQGVLPDASYNEIPFLTREEYEHIYQALSISPRLLHPEQSRKRVISNKKFRGMSKDHNSYKVHIGYQGKQLYLGTYPTEKRAAQAYNYASFYLYGLQGYINDVSPLVDDHDISRIATFLGKYGVLKSDT